MSGERSSGQVSPAEDFIAPRGNAFQRWSQFLSLGFFPKRLVNVSLTKLVTCQILFLSQEEVCNTRVDCRDGGDIKHCFFEDPTTSIALMSVATKPSVLIDPNDTVSWSIE